MTTTTPMLLAPDLKIDERMRRKYGTTLTVQNRYERRVVWNLLHVLAAAGWTVYEIDDGDECVKPEDAKAAMEILFDLEDVHVVMTNGQQRFHHIRLIFGNGEDLICDFSFARDDADGFEALMNAFDTTIYG